MRLPMKKLLDTVGRYENANFIPAFSGCGKRWRRTGAGKKARSGFLSELAIIYAETGQFGVEGAT